jgi:hypothetical protein
MLSVTFMLSDSIMPCMLTVVMLSVVLLTVVALSIEKDAIRNFGWKSLVAPV